MSALARAISRRGKNPLWVFAWGLFTASVGFIAQHEYAWPETNAAFARKRTQLNIASREFRRGEEMVASWREGFRHLNDSIDAYSGRQASEMLTEARWQLPVENLMRSLTVSRRLLSEPMASISRLSFENALLHSLQAKLLEDLRMADSVLARRVRWLSQVLRDSLSQAINSASDLNLQLEETRHILEQAERRTQSEEALERARTEFNNTLEEGRAMEARLKMRSRLAIVAWGYAGAFVGVVIGAQVSGRRKRKDRAVRKG